MTQIYNDLLIEPCYEKLIEYFSILSRNRRSKYHVLMHRLKIFGREQRIILVYKNTGKQLDLMLCYPITDEQHLNLIEHSQKGFKSKTMESGQRTYLDCHFAYASVNFSLSEELDFDSAFGYLTRMLERYLEILIR